MAYKSKKIINVAFWGGLCATILGIIIMEVTKISPKDALEKVIVCVDAPQMITGPGSVVIIDSSKQPLVKNYFSELERAGLQNLAGKNRTEVDVGMPFLYISLQWKSGRKTVLSSMHILEGREESEVSKSIAPLLKILKVDSSDVKKALMMAEKSEIQDEPIMPNSKFSHHDEHHP